MKHRWRSLVSVSNTKLLGKKLHRQGDSTASADTRNHLFSSMFTIKATSWSKRTLDHVTHLWGEKGRNISSQVGPWNGGPCVFRLSPLVCVYVFEVWFQVSYHYRAEGLSEGRWLVLWGRWGGRGCCSSTSNPTWSHRSARVYQAKAAWSLNAHAANLFNYSPSSAACLMRGLSTDNAGNWTIGFAHSIIDHWFHSRLDV